MYNGYIGTQPVPQSSVIVSQGTFNTATDTINVGGGYDVGNIIVYVNGIRLRTTDYVATDGLTIVFNDTWSAGDEYLVEEYRNFSIANHYTKSEMASSVGASLIGTEDGNVQTDLDRRAVTFDTVVDMKAATFLKVGDKVRTLGYYSAGDGGGNDYEIVAAGTGTDNGGSFIDLTGVSGQAKGLFIYGSVNVEQFGAVGDGVTDDTAAIRRALSSGVDIIDGKGSTYAISAPLNIPENITLENINLTYLPDYTKPIVIAASGQSNMRGINAIGGTFKANPNVKVWCSTSQGGVYKFQTVDLSTTTYYQPADTASSTFGGGSNNLAVAFCHRIQELTGRPVYLIMDSMGNRAISDWLNNGPRTVALDAAIQSGLSALGLNAIDCFLWHQGENDATNTTYHDDFNALIADYRSRSWMKWDTPVIAGMQATTNASYNDINKLWYRLSLTVKDSYGAVAEGSDYINVADTHGLTVVDGAHFSGDSLFELGYYRYAEALVKVGSLFDYALVIKNNNNVTCRDVEIDCSFGSNGVLIENSANVIVSDIKVKHFLETGIRTRVKAGQLKIENPLVKQYEWNETGFNTRAGRFGIGINISTADGHLVNPISNYCWCPMRYNGFYNFQTVSPHPFNGQTDGSVVDAINILIEGDAFHTTFFNSYLDKGRVIVHNPETQFIGGLVVQGDGNSNKSNFELVSHTTWAEFREFNVSDFMFSVSVDITPVKFTTFLDSTFATSELLKFIWKGNIGVDGSVVYAVEQNRAGIQRSHGIFYRPYNSSYTVGSTRSLRLHADFENDSSTIGDSEIYLATDGVDRWKLAAGGSLVPMAGDSYNLGDPNNFVRSTYTTTVRYATTNTFDSAGTGSPEGVLVAGVGSTYRRLDGGAGTTFYVKESGTGNTGWVAK